MLIIYRYALMIVTHGMMKAVIFCVLCTFGLSSAAGGILRSVIYSDLIKCNLDKSSTSDIDISQIKIYFYDFQNDYSDGYPINDAVNALRNYNLDFSRRLVFMVPGYRSGITKQTEETTRQSFRNARNIYLIIVDHSAYTADTNVLESYNKAVSYVFYIGQALGELLAHLGYPAQNIHAIGYSLGSQILGYTGAVFTGRTSQKLWRISGIDPAGPCFANGPVEDQLRSGLAYYVDVYHCNAGELGTTSVLGDADFFVNDGMTEPNCDRNLILKKSNAAICSHGKCVNYYMNTVARPGLYLAWRCDSYKNFRRGRCAGNDVTIGGFYNPGNATGVFYLSTEGYGDS